MTMSIKNIHFKNIYLWLKKAHTKVIDTYKGVTAEGTGLNQRPMLVQVRVWDPQGGRPEPETSGTGCESAISEVAGLSQWPLPVQVQGKKPPWEHARTTLVLQSDPGERWATSRNTE